MKRSRYANMTVAEQIREGLLDALAHVRGELILRTTTLPALPPNAPPEPNPIPPTSPSPD